MGLVEGLGKIGKKVIGAIRQPSGGPTFNIKGSAAGGGLAQCIPLTDFSLGLTGDIDAITNAHNLSMVALTARMQHEFNYSDEGLAKRGLQRLDIDPRNIAQGWCIDFCAQALREIIIGLGSDMDGFMMKSGFQITVSSEIMAILAVASDLKDMRERMGRIVVAYSKAGKPVTTHDLGVDGAMTAIMAKAINPNLLQTIEGQPVLVHAGPFANIAIGQSSIIADRVGAEARRLPRHGERVRRGHRVREVLEPEVPVQRAHAELLGPRLHRARAEDARRRPAGGAGQGAGQGVHGEERRPGGEGRGEPPGAHRDHQALRHRAGRVHQPLLHGHRRGDRRRSARLPSAAGARVALSKHWEKGGDGAVELAETVVDACNQHVEVQVPLRAFHAALRADQADRHEGVRRRRRVLHARWPRRSSRPSRRTPSSRSWAPAW